MDSSYEEWAEVYKTLGDKTRLRILSLLRQRELCVCELTSILQLTQPGVSQHLKKLKQVGLVKERKTAQWVHYSLRLEKLKEAGVDLDHFPDPSNDLIELDQRGLSCV